MLEHVIIPKSQDAYCQLIESHRPISVVFRLNMIGMLAPIELNSQSTRSPVEIHNVAANAMLTTKSVSRQTLDAKHPPKFGFGIRGLAAHCPSELQESPVAITRDLHDIDVARTTPDGQTPGIGRADRLTRGTIAVDETSSGLPRLWSGASSDLVSQEALPAMPELWNPHQGD
jgi:hypothetical protein